jgi:nitrile hydratase subunit beta
MNNVHDMGGMQGFGPINPEPEHEEPVFHADWERRVFALCVASGALGIWSLDEARHNRESLPPLTYLGNSYYGIWFEGLLRQMVNEGLISPEELENGRSDNEASDRAKALSPLRRDNVAPLLARGKPSALDSGPDPRFKPGDAVTVVNEHPTGHTRAPRYARGRSGIVETDHGIHIFADKNAHRIREGQHLYTVRFSAQELWGQRADARDTVSLELWDDHLEHAP